MLISVVTTLETVEKAEKEKADLLQCKSSADEECVKAEKELIKLKDFQEKQQKEIIMSRDTRQLYCGVSKKTILLQGIQETEEDEESVQDMIEIHFQKPSNRGGEIENIKYVSKGITWVCFEEDI
ncbi:n-myhypothetical protein [Limosa lapponica baueri]|uniref:NID domain-containing protein n=1 Tax=Limosa lapponica baueri TaxID=1758121 RepID=A0A2I0T888_LIMLA|nr:n-myhypothetical protein [Limosa lapponica baueri]